MEREAKAAKKMTKERDRFRVLVTKEIAWADRRIGALASDAALLQGDLEALDPAVPGLDWPALKTRVERPLVTASSYRNRSRRVNREGHRTPSAPARVAGCG